MHYRADKLGKPYAINIKIRHYKAVEVFKGDQQIYFAAEVVAEKERIDFDSGFLEQQLVSLLIKSTTRSATASTMSGLVCILT